MKEHQFICCICGSLCTGYGNNPNGAVLKTPTGEVYEATFKENEVCCNECDYKFVIPGRLYKLSKNKEDK